MSKALNIFDFSDYRRYLMAWLEREKKARTFTLTRLAEVAQVHPTFLSHVLAGTKHLSLEQAAFITRRIGHTRLEQDYFFALIQLDRAGTADLRDYWLERKRELEAEKNQLSRRFEAHHELTEEQRAVFYSSWLYLAVWVSTAIAGGQSIAQIAERFRLSSTKASEILAFLAQVGLCIENDGEFRMGKVHVHVGNESPFVVKHHSNWRMKALQKMDTREQKELFFTGPMSISKSDFDLLREKLNVLIRETVDVAKASTSEGLYCLNIDFFNVES